MKESTCVLCHGVANEEDFCCGCEQVVCEDCDVSAPFGSHDPEDHRLDLDHEDLDDDDDEDLEDLDDEDLDE